MDNQRVGFIGLGVMGRAMAENLAKAGWPLVVHDLRPEPLVALAGLGAEVAGSPREVGARCRRLVIMVRTFPQVEATISGPAGALETLEEGSTVIIMSTISPSQVQRVAALVASKGVRALDAPVSGGVGRAGVGTLTIMAAGAEEAFRDCRELLQAMGSNVYYLGQQVGAGQTVKMLNQLLYCVGLAALAEALVLGARAGVDLKMLLEVLSHATADSWVLRTRTPAILDGSFKSGGALDITLKDLGVILSAGEELSVPLFLSNAAREVFQLARLVSGPEEDDVAVAKVLAGLVGVTLGASDRAVKE